MRAWQAWKDTSMPTPDGPLPVAKGDIVVVLIVPTWLEAFGALASLLTKEKRER